MHGFIESDQARLRYLENTLKALIEELKKDGLCMEINFLTETERLNDCEKAVDRFLQQAGGWGNPEPANPAGPGKAKPGCQVAYISNKGGGR